MYVTLAHTAYIHDLLESFLRYSWIKVAQPLSVYLKSLKVGVLSQTGRSKTKKWLRHENSNYSYIVTSSTFSCILSLSSNFHRPRNMTYRHLVTRLLNFYILKTHKFRGPDRHYEQSFNSVCFALVSWAFNQRVELSLANNLIHLEATNITNVHCYLHLWLYIANSYNYATNCDEWTYCMRLYLTHFTYWFLAKLARYNKDLVASFQFFRYYSFASWVSWWFS
jgi:hypothetical protein